jgi:hypothetical protein
MRRPVSVKCCVVGKSYYFPLRPDSESVWPARSTVKAERSEFILSLDCGRAGDIKVDPGEESR